MKRLWCWAGTAVLVLSACGGGEQAKPILMAQTKTALGAAAKLDVAPVSLPQQFNLLAFGLPATPQAQAYFEQYFSSIHAPATLAEFSDFLNKPTAPEFFNNLSKLAQFQALYGAGDTRSFIDAVYLNAFGRKGDTAGATWWAELVDSGRLTRLQTVFAIAANARDDDAKAFANKTGIATALAARMTTAQTIFAADDPFGVKALRAVMLTVSANTDVENAGAQLDQFIENLPGRNRGVAPPPALGYFPDAFAGFSQTGVVGQTLSLRGADIFGTYKNPLQQSWKILAQPAPGAANLDNSDPSKPNFLARVPGDYVVEFSVADDPMIARATSLVRIGTRPIVPELAPLGRNALFQALHMASYGRPARPSDMALLTYQYNNSVLPDDLAGMNALYGLNPTVRHLLARFSASEEWRAASSNQAWLPGLYQNLFGRAPDTAGAQWWAQKIDSGALSQEAALLAIASSAQGEDAARLSNRISMAQVFTNRNYAPDDLLASSDIHTAELIRSAFANVDQQSCAAVSTPQADLLLQGLGNDINPARNPFPILPSIAQGAWAFAGFPKCVVLGSQVNLAGTLLGVAPGSAISYSWKVVAGKEYALNNADTATPSFTPNVTGLFALELTIKRGHTTAHALNVIEVRSK